MSVFCPHSYRENATVTERNIHEAERFLRQFMPDVYIVGVKQKPAGHGGKYDIW